MRVSRKEDFALLIMSFLARNYSARYISTAYIAQKANLSPLFMKHITVNLKNEGLIESKEGTGGGYRLARDPEKISVAEILKSVSPKVVNLSCDKDTCRLVKEDCLCLNFWSKFNKKMGGYLKEIKLADIAL